MEKPPLGQIAIPLSGDHQRLNAALAIGDRSSLEFHD